MEIKLVDRLRDLMQSEGLNQTKLGEKIGVRQNTVSAWLLEKKEPCIRSLWLLADYFDIDIDYLVGRKDY